MGKLIADSVFDAAIDKLATSTYLVFCSAEPADYADIESVTLINQAVIPGIGNGDFTKADGAVSGRRLIVAAQSGMTPSADGTVVCAVLHDGTTLLGRTAVTSQAVTTSQVWDSLAVNFEFRDPA